MNLSHELLAIVQALEAEGMPYAICGGFAVMLHGYPRATHDLDLLVQESDLARVTNVVATLGFDLAAGTFSFKRGTPEETRFWRVSKIEADDHLVLDVLLVTPVIEEAWRSREQIAWQGHSVWVVSRDGLKTMKLLAGRAKDLADLQALGILPQDDVEPEPV
jgi:hypothetical protein